MSSTPNPFSVRNLGQEGEGSEARQEGRLESVWVSPVAKKDNSARVGSMLLAAGLGSSLVGTAMLFRDKLAPLITLDTIGFSALALGGALVVAGHAKAVHSKSKKVNFDKEEAEETKNPITNLFVRPSESSQRSKSLIAFKLLNDEHHFKATVKAFQKELVRPYETKQNRDDVILGPEILKLVQTEAEKERRIAEAARRTRQESQLHKVNELLAKGHSSRRILQEIQPRLFVYSFDPTNPNHHRRDPVRDLTGTSFE
jgi:hypothetical protein